MSYPPNHQGEVMQTMTSQVKIGLMPVLLDKEHLPILRQGPLLIRNFSFQRVRMQAHLIHQTTDNLGAVLHVLWKRPMETAEGFHV